MFQMKSQRWIGNLFAAGMVALLLTGCQSNNSTSSAEAEALRQQIAQLEQQVSALEQQVADRQDNAAQENVQEQTLSAQSNNTDAQPQTEPGADSGQQSQNDMNTAGAQQSQSNAGNTSSGSLATYTIEELGSMVDAYVTKANAVTPSETAAEALEQFFALKQEAKQIDNTLDHHEDELEMLYRSQALTKEEYKRREHELDHLEDKLDDAKDYLELVFGIDD